MRGLAPSIFVITLVTCPPVQALYSVDDTGMGDERGSFSASFLQAYDKADSDNGSPHLAQRFEKLLKQYTQPKEQAELQITLGVIYGQTAGLVDYEKSVAHFTEGLKFKLPPIVLVQVYMWRGGSYEIAKHKLDALKDYVRGLHICLGYKLPVKLPPLLFKRVPIMGGVRTPENDALIAEVNRKTAEHRMQGTMIQERDDYVEAIKRVIGDEKIPAIQFKELVAALVKDEKVTDEILRYVSSANTGPEK